MLSSHAGGLCCVSRFWGICLWNFCLHPKTIQLVAVGEKIDSNILFQEGVSYSGSCIHLGEWVFIKTASNSTHGRNENHWCTDLTLQTVRADNDSVEWIVQMWLIYIKHLFFIHFHRMLLDNVHFSFLRNHIFPRQFGGQMALNSSTLMSHHTFIAMEKKPDGTKAQSQSCLIHPKLTQNPKVNQFKLQFLKKQHL